MMHKATVILFFVIFSAFVVSVVQVSSISSYPNRKVVIVVDLYHKPVMLNFTKALNYLNESLGGIIRVFYMNYSLEYSTLSGVDLFLIPPFNKTFSSGEVNAVKEYIERGGHVLIMGLDCVKGREFNPNTIAMNALISDLKLNYTIEFNVTAGLGVELIDPLQNDSYLHINSEYFTPSFREKYVNSSLDMILESTVITVSGVDINATPAILIPPHVYALGADPNSTILYFESGAGVMTVYTLNLGALAVIGFALSLSDLINPVYNASWIDIAQNKVFWIKFIQAFLGLYTNREPTIYDLSVAVYFTGGLGLVLLVIGIFMVLKGVIEKKKEKKEVKISELLKKLREQ